MATYQSVQSNTSDNTGTVTITKPVSLAVGDLMIAGIFVDADNGSSASVSTPSGWTQTNLVDLGGGLSALAVFTKTADSADVAASNFTFNGTGSTGNMTMIGHIIRLTNWGGYAGNTTAIDTSTATTLTMTGLTQSPAVASSLYVVFAGRAAAVTVNINSVAIATSNPTWTERAESGVNAPTTKTQFAVYTATRPETTATGNYTITYSSTSNIRSGAVGLVVIPPINGSIVNPDQRVNAYAISPIPNNRIDAIADTPTLRLGTHTKWVGEAKPNTTWQFENK